MAGPSTIQRVPAGLLDYLKMKGSGQLPTELGGEVRAVIDTSALYLDEVYRSASGVQSSAVNANIGFPASNTVPAGEMWLINYVSISISGGVTSPGDKCTFSPYVVRPVSAAAPILFPGLVITSTVDNRDAAAGIVYPPFTLILHPGDAWWGRWFNTVATTNVAATLGYGYWRLTI